MEATVESCRNSRSFAIQRGIRQGDPVLPTLCNCVLHERIEKLIQSWAYRGYGYKLCSKDAMLSLHFADDILLVSKSLKEITIMVCDVAKSSAEIGLQFNYKKTKALWNGNGPQVPKTLSTAQGNVDILLPYAAVAYLGRELCFTDPHDKEIGTRMTKAWRSFFNVQR